MSDSPGCVALLTDFGAGSIYVGEMHAVIAGVQPDVRVIDLCHTIRPQNVREAAFVLDRTYQLLPQGSVIVVVVDPEVGTGRKIIAVRTANYTFIAPDNGVLSLVMAREMPLSIVQVENRKYFANRFFAHTFQGRWIFAPAAAHLAAGLDIGELGLECPNIKDLRLPAAAKNGDTITGEVVYIDSYGNAVTNIDRALLDADLELKKRPRATLAGAELSRFGLTYADAPVGQPLLLIGSMNCLEVACNGGDAARSLGLNAGDAITVHLDPAKENERATS